MNAAAARARLGAVSFVQRFGGALHAHLHFHCCVIDAVFAGGEDGQVRFTEAAALTPEDRAAMQQQARRRVLRWFARAGHLDPADARDMAGWDHGGGFSLDTSVRGPGPRRPEMAAALSRAPPPLCPARINGGGPPTCHRAPSPAGCLELPSRPLLKHPPTPPPWLESSRQACDG